MTSKPKIIKSTNDLLKLFKAMQDFSVQSLAVDGIMIQRGSPFETAHSPIMIPLHNPSDSAPGSYSDNQNGPLPEPPPSPPLSPEDLESALYSLREDF